MALALEQYKAYWVEEHKIKEILLKRLERRRKRSLVVSIENGDRLPEEVIIEILSWLPVNTLLQYRSVCKLWNTIITGSHFISKHVKNYYANNNWRDCLVVQYYITQAGEINVYELLLARNSKKVLSYKEVDTPIYNTYICGPCNGLYFLWVSYSNPYPSLWNPALNEFERLPNFVPKPNLPSYLTPSYKVYGFGFDSKTNDYKVICIHGYRDTNNEDSKIIDYPLSLFIYSLRTNSWRYWGDLNNSYYLEQNKSYVFVNSCCYWLGTRDEFSYGRNNEVVIAFDITLEAYEEISLPKYKKPDCERHLIVFHDTIAFVSVPDTRTNFSIWTWNEGVWAQKLIIEVGFEVWGPFSHWWDNMVLFAKACGKLVLCDTDTSEMWELDGPRAGHDIATITVYKESLVSIKEVSGKERLVEIQSKVEHEEIEIPDWLWPEVGVTVEIPTWLWPDMD